MKKSVIAFILLAAISIVAFSFAGCTPEQKQQFIDSVKKITVQKYTAETYTYAPFEGVEASDITFTSNNESIASVSPDGVVTAINVGMTVITAKHGTEEKSIIFLSTAREIKINKEIGDKLDEESIASIFNVYPQVISFSTSDLETSGLAAKEEDGSYTFKQKGKTVINGFYEGEKIYAVIEITVTEATDDE